MSGGTFPPFQSLSQAPRVQWQSSLSPPPGAYYVTGDDALFFQCNNSDPAFTALVSYRLLLPDGTVVPAQEVFRPTSDRTTNNFSRSLTEGFLLSVTVLSNGGNQRRGSSFCRVWLARNTAATFFFTDLLIMGYAGGFEPLAWPGGSLVSSAEGRGLMRRIAGTTPAAGAEISETVPNFAMWRLVTFDYQLVTSAAVANRVSNLFMDDGTTIFSANGTVAAQAASLTETYSWASGLVNQQLNTAAINQPFPNQMILIPGFRIRTITANLQAADQYSAVSYLVEEWLSP